MDHVETGIHRTKGDAVVLELAFRGGHWQVGSEIREAISSAVKASAPAAVLLDLSNFRYRGGDYASGFVEAFLDREGGRTRPACFVGAPAGVRSLFDLIDIGGHLGVRYFRSRAEAFDYLDSRLEPGG